MSYIVEIESNLHHQHAVVCRDTLDGRVSIEHQVLDGSRICQTELVATVAPADVGSHVQECERALGLRDAASDMSDGKQTHSAETGQL